MNVQTTHAFDHDYARLSAELKDRADKQIRLLLSNPRHPSLRLKKMQGSDDVWEARVTRGCRMTLQRAGDAVILRRIGAHDVLRER
jgi:mRNA-degrading endonuclease YafQ of YafQ-DinJ toxin-antitoxin module